MGYNLWLRDCTDRRFWFFKQCPAESSSMIVHVGVLVLTDVYWHKAEEISLPLWQIDTERKRDRWLKTAMKYPITCLQKSLAVRGIINGSDSLGESCFCNSH